MRFERAVNILLVLILAWVGYRQARLFFHNHSQEGQPAPQFVVPTLASVPFDSAATNRPLVVVFWATWCVPCQAELSRINSLVENHEINAESVLAISSFEEPRLVDQIAKERKYLFPVGLDVSGEVARSYGVAATPTVVFIGKDKNVHWKTTGLSPLLGFRVVNFLKE